MKIRSIAILALGGAVAGCGDLAEDLGLGKQSPDEFQVVRRAPLSVPPSLALRPPRPGAVADNRLTSESQVRETLFNSGAGDAGGSIAGGPIMTLNFDDSGQATVADGQASAFTSFGPSEGEVALLARAGADRAPASIRGVVDAESNERVFEDDYLLDRILFWRDADRQRVVDAGGEAARIRADAAAGRRTTGEGAVTRDSSSGGSSSTGLLDAIF